MDNSSDCVMVTVGEKRRKIQRLPVLYTPERHPILRDEQVRKLLREKSIHLISVGDCDRLRDSEDDSKVKGSMDRGTYPLLCNGYLVTFFFVDYKKRVDYDIGEFAPWIPNSAINFLNIMNETISKIKK